MENRFLNSERLEPRRPNFEQRGFTYLALMLFVVVVGIASAGTATFWSTIQRRDAEENLLFVGGEFRLALRKYAAATPQGQSPYPPSLEALLRDPRFPDVRRHLRKLYADPITHRTDWVLLKSPDGGIAALHSASSETTFRRTQFPAEFSQFEGKETYDLWMFSTTP